MIKRNRKILAIICSIALVIGSFATYSAIKVSADDYSGLTYTNITNNNNSEFDQKLKGSQYAINTGSTFNALNACLYQNISFGELYIAGPWSAAGLQATVNDEANSVTIEGAGLRIYNAANYLTKRYNVISVSTSAGDSGEIIIYCPEIPDESSSQTPTQTSTQAPTTTPAAGWTPVPGMSDDYAYRINSNTLTGFSNFEFYMGGTEEYLHIHGSSASGLASATVTLNGVNQPYNNGFYFEHTDDIVGLHLNGLENDDYHDITVTGTGGTISFTLKKGNPGTQAVQPTNVVATAISGVPGAANVTWECEGALTGQTYNIYVDNVLIKTGITKLTGTVNNLSADTHTVEVSGVYSGEETERTSATVNISAAVKSTSNISIEGFQIQTNFPDRSDPPDHVAFRSMCKAPNKGSKITIDDKQYEVDKFGLVYALDYENNTGYNENNNLDASYTLLNETPVVGEDWTYEGLRLYDDVEVAYGFVATNKAIIDDYKPADTDNTYYAITMPDMDPMARCTIFFRAYVVATDGTIIYGKKTAYTSVCEIADIIYSNSMSKNASAHNYIYNGILHNTAITPATNPHYKASPITYGWNGNLYIGFRKVPDSWNPSTHTPEEMQYISIGDYNIHASSFYDNQDLGIVGAAASYKGITNEEMAVRIDQPGWGHLDEWGNFINWGIQIKLPNRTAFARLEDGKTYKMTVLYRATNAGEMKMKCEGIDALPAYFNATAGTNKIEKTFVFHQSYMNVSNDASIVFAPCGDDDTTHPGFPKGTIVSDFDVSFTEVN